ncbi:MAG: hypothetical protein M3P93_15450 [Actinomycetota bacterium]|nr:hypothetical protein [Actinomycetota bacterium]
MDLHDLTPVVTAEGPFVTVLVDSESDVEQAADKYDLEWKNVLKELESEGVDARTVEAVGAARGEHAQGAARLVIATVPDSTVRLAVSLVAPPRRPVVEVAALPRLRPLVEDLTNRVPHVVVLADRTGADVAAYFDAEQVAKEVTVKGTQLHLKKVQVGGWAHHRYQHRAEDRWEKNAKLIAETVAQLVPQVGAQLVVGVGDQRELQLVHEHLPTEQQTLWRELPGSRGQDGSEELVPQRVADLLALHVAQSTLDLLAEYAQERGQQKRACDGLADVVDALRKAQVETLLITTDTEEHGTLWFGPEPSVIATTGRELIELGVEDPKEGPLVDVLIRAAVGTGAGVQLVPGEMEQAPQAGVGAVLRYADSLGSEAAAQ